MRMMVMMERRKDVMGRGAFFSLGLGFPFPFLGPVGVARLGAPPAASRDGAALKARLCTHTQPARRDETPWSE